jgi:predicted Fe-S protein YdhL (DUF1289 family)
VDGAQRAAVRGRFASALIINRSAFMGLRAPFSLYPCDPMPGIHITDIEAAINYWRERSPSPDGVTLAPELRALAEVYALLVFYHEEEADEASFPAKAMAAWRTWYETTADTPCIAICSTSQGDALCKGCGRSFDEVQHWPAMTPGEKRASWRRITLEGSSWRFGRYADRALEKKAGAAPDSGA